MLDYHCWQLQNRKQQPKIVKTATTTLHYVHGSCRICQHFCSWGFSDVARRLTVPDYRTLYLYDAQTVTQTMFCVCNQEITDFSKSCHPGNLNIKMDQLKIA